MNKKQLVGKISSSMNLSKADAERTFDGITEIILNIFYLFLKKTNKINAFLNKYYILWISFTKLLKKA